jgi:hypothetical protein
MALLAGTTLPSKSVALEPSGTAVEVNRNASASGTAGARELISAGPVFMGDEVRTDPNGRAQIRFVDDTKLVVGPNSRIEIDSFVFDADRTASKVGIDVVKGAFRFISGTSPSQAYSIRTPTMTIGVRGTVFDVAVRAGGESAIALYEGAARVCDAGGQCIDIQGGCTIVVVPPGGGLSPLGAGAERRRRLAAFFPFASQQQGLAPGFRVDASACGEASLPAAPVETGDQKAAGEPLPEAPDPEPPPPDEEGEGDFPGGLNDFPSDEGEPPVT